MTDTDGVFTLYGTVAPKSEDSGMALIAQIGGEGDSALFVKIQSWSEVKRHPEMDKLTGKKVEVIIRILD